jgi:CubicO group peptidase (beta-lactamase class C family)
MKRIEALILASILAFALMPHAAPAQSLPTARPGSMGFSTERLERLHAQVQDYIDRGKHAGAVTIIARHGRIVDLKAYGWRDLEARAPMRTDTIVRIYSMSKVIASVGIMQLIEEGRLSLNDPVTRYIPELKDLKVCTGGTADAPVLEAAKRPITIKHLLTHTAGFAYDFSAKEPVKTLYQKADLFESESSQQFIERLAKLPLAQQPGEGYLYGVNTDVLGHLIEVVSGWPIEIYLQARVFGPLGMKDTSFDVPPEKLARLAKLYETGPDGKLRPVAKPPYGAYAQKGRGFPSCGGGMFSTADDYVRFAQMLLNGGKLDSRQVLGRKTVELMTANHLAFLEKPTVGGNGWEGFGLGGSVRVDLANANTLGSVGEFGWNGAATTTFRIDPKEQTAALLFTQHLPYDQHGIFAKFYTLFYASLE